MNVFKVLAMKWLEDNRLHNKKPWVWDGKGYERISLPLVNRIYPHLIVCLYVLYRFIMICMIDTVMCWMTGHEWHYYYTFNGTLRRRCSWCSADEKLD